MVEVRVSQFLEALAVVRRLGSDALVAKVATCVRQAKIERQQTDTESDNDTS